MSEPQLTGLQKRAEKYIDKVIIYQISSDETVEGNFIGFDKSSVDRAIIQLSNAADRITVPLMYVVNYFENGDDPDIEALKNAHQKKRPGYDF